MAENSGIEWTHHTANIWWGCTKVHEGCDNCYAETLANKFGESIWGNDSPRRLIKGFFGDLNRFQRLAAEAGEKHRVFVGSMMDIFEKPMPLINNKGEKLEEDSDFYRQKFFANISQGMYPNLVFLLLTKRPSNINKYIPESWKENPPENVMFGTSPVNQATADKLVRQLLEVNGRRFLSVEPQLDSVNIQGFLFSGQIHWVIQGGESGDNRRPFDIDWAYYMRHQCEATDVPYFFKQIDKVIPIPDEMMIKQFPKM